MFSVFLHEKEDADKTLSGKGWDPPPLTPKQHVIAAFSSCVYW